MSIKEMLQKVKPFYNLILILIIASIFFALGQVSAIEERHTPIKIEYSGAGQPASLMQASETVSGIGSTTASNSGEVVGSKSGKKYYFPWCSTAKRIKPENQVKFNSMQEARNAGFVPGGNCKGLQ